MLQHPDAGPPTVDYYFYSSDWTNSNIYDKIVRSPYWVYRRLPKVSILEPKNDIHLQGDSPVSV